MELKIGWFLFNNYMVWHVLTLKCTQYSFIQKNITICLITVSDTSPKKNNYIFCNQLAHNNACIFKIIFIIIGILKRASALYLFSPSDPHATWRI